MKASYDTVGQKRMEDMLGKKGLPKHLIRVKKRSKARLPIETHSIFLVNIRHRIYDRRTYWRSCDGKDEMFSARVH